MSLPLAQSDLRDENLAIANLFYDLAELHKPAPSHWGYKRAAKTILRLPQFLSDVASKDMKIPNLGPATLSVAREYLALGISPTVDRALAESPKAALVAQKRKLRSRFLSYAMVQRVLGGHAGSAISRADYRGDFQMHSRASDGADTIAAMAAACLARGYTCASISDHSHGLAIAGGISIEAMREQGAEIDALNARFVVEFRLFKGIEANILASGDLDLSFEELRGLELVIASPHSALRKEADQTPRFLRAVSTPGVHILGHPRGRVYNSRVGVVVDWPAVFRQAARTGVAIEIDGDPSRQDIDFRLAAAAKKAGCLFALDSDAHTTTQLFFADYALAHARLAGIPGDRIVNCWPPDRILQWAARAWDR